MGGDIEHCSVAKFGHRGRGTKLACSPVHSADRLIGSAVEWAGLFIWLPARSADARRNLLVPLWIYQGGADMSTDTSPPSHEPEPYGPGSYMSFVRGPGHRPPMSKRNKAFLWIFLAIQAIFLGWTIYTGVATPQTGLGLPLGLWAVSVVIGGATYLIWQLPRNRR
jgi:hypothetical protein